MPAFAETAVDKAITSGIAKPRACGQAMTSTVTVRTTASSTLPASSQATNVIDPSGRGDVEQNRRKAVGEHLGAAAAGLGVGHETLDPGQRRFVSDGVHPYTHRRVGRNRSGDDTIATLLGHGLRLTGDHRLVELCRAVDDHAVSRYAATRSHEDDVTDGQLVEADATDVVSVDHLGFVGKQFGEGAEGAAGLSDRLHLLPVTEQHDRDEEGKLPPELEIEPIQRGGNRRGVGDRDRHRDQQHHPRLTGADLSDPTGEEGPAAPPEHDRAEHRTEPRHRGEVDGVVEPAHHHLAGDDEGDRQEQADPEAATEHLRIVAGVLVVVLVVLVHESTIPPRGISDGGIGPGGYIEHRPVCTPADPQTLPGRWHARGARVQRAGAVGASG